MGRLSCGWVCKWLMLMMVMLVVSGGGGGGVSGVKYWL